jgi:hypothetical protein
MDYLISATLTPTKIIVGIAVIVAILLIGFLVTRRGSA